MVHIMQILIIPAIFLLLLAYLDYRAPMRHLDKGRNPRFATWQYCIVVAAILLILAIASA